MSRLTIPNILFGHHKDIWTWFPGRISQNILPEFLRHACAGQPAQAWKKGRYTRVDLIWNVLSQWLIFCDASLQLKTNQQVLITELCTGGSLYGLLDDPENRLGMEETEFIFVLRDLGVLSIIFLSFLCFNFRILHLFVMYF